MDFYDRQSPPRSAPVARTIAAERGVSLAKAEPAPDEEVVLVPTLRPVAMAAYLIVVIGGIVAALLTKSPVGA